MDLIDYFAGNHAHLLYLIAGISFVVELTVMGMSGPLLFFAIACFTTGVLTHMGLLNTWESELSTVGLLSGIIAFMLWKPLKRFQNGGIGKDTSSDMIGQKVPSVTEITAVGGSIRYSGVNWSARLDSASGVDSITEDVLCEIVAVEGNVMIVKLAG